VLRQVEHGQRNEGGMVRGVQQQGLPQGLLRRSPEEGGT
jgi:hypothetical protein